MKVLKDEFREVLGMVVSSSKRTKVVMYMIVSLALYAIGVSWLATYYLDCRSLTVWTVSFWDVLFAGDLGGYYDYLQQNLRGALHQNNTGSWLMLLPWSLWNFPLWLMHQGEGNMEILQPLAMWYSKAFLVVVLLVGAIFIYRIIKELTGDTLRASIGFALMMTSPEVLMSVGFAGQDEIVYISFFMIGLYAWIKGKKGFFYLWSTLSITICPVMLLPYVALLVIDSRNIFRLAGMVVMPLLPSILYQYLYRHSEYYASGRMDERNVLKEMLGFSNFLETPSLTIPLVLLLIIGIYALLYCRIGFGKDRIRDGITSLALLMVIYSFFMSNLFYRTFIYIPFLLLFVLANEKDHIEEWKTKMTLFVSISSISSFVTLGMNSPLNMNTLYTVQSKLVLWICSLTGSDRYTNFAGVYSKLASRIGALDQLSIVCGAAVMVLLLLLFMMSLNYIRKNLKFVLPIRYALLIYVAILPCYSAVYWALLFFDFSKP